MTTQPSERAVASHSARPAPPTSSPPDDALLSDALGLAAGETPFPWQARLLRRFMEGDIPRSLDIPTGLGKTATLAIGLLARSLGAPLPRRLVYVVDRRAVVDQATEEAVRLRDWVAARPHVREGLGLDERGALPVSALRGKLVDNRAWLEDPSLPAIVVGTVDMIGSRLLFGGYRASRKIRPYLAGLLGHDTLFILDEAHLVPPFERLLERVALGAADLGSSLSAHLTPPPPRLLSLSATGRSRGGEPFDLDESDLEHTVIDRRLSAPKRLTLEQLDSREDLPVAVARCAWEIAEQGAVPVRCIMYLGSRVQAEQAQDQLSKLFGLDKLKKGQEPPADLELLVGGRRVFERTAAADRLAELGFLASGSTARARPAFLIATSAGEVGIDLDADHLVCDLVPWERMVQRLGRVNRRGLGDARVSVLQAPPSPKAPPAVGARLSATNALIQRLPVHGDGSRDVSPGALRALQIAARTDPVLAAVIKQASTPEPSYPALDRPTLDAWSMTSLAHHPGRPAVAPWLRGWVEDRPQTAVLWRKHLPLPGGRLPTRFLEAAPPHASELLETDSSLVADWLARRVKKLLARAGRAGNDTDVLAHDAIVALTRPGSGEAPQCWTLRKLAELPKKTLVERVLPRAELIVDARLGGLSFGLLDPGRDDAPPTLDRPGWIEVPYRVAETTAPTAIDDPVWRERDRLPLARSPDGEVIRWLVVEKRLHDAATEDDRSAGRPQHLTEHQDWAAACARRLAQRLALPDDAERVLVIAARLHDEGKRAPRWQAAFHAPSEVPYAKTRGPVNVHLLDGYRHEFGSLPYVERDPELATLPDDQRDLVLHLVASHHGFARPVISTRGCADAPPSALEERARKVAQRFWALQRQWGPWGLAWWESLLRAADQQASRDNDAADAVAAGEEA